MGVFGVALYKWSIVEWTPLSKSFKRKNVEYVESSGVYTNFPKFGIVLQKWSQIMGEPLYYFHVFSHINLICKREVGNTVAFSAPPPPLTLQSTNHAPRGSENLPKR